MCNNSAVAADVEEEEEKPEICRGGCHSLCLCPGAKRGARIVRAGAGGGWMDTEIRQQQKSIVPKPPT